MKPGKLKAAKLQQILTELADQHGGVLTEEQVVEFARPPDSPIHGEFEWDKDVGHEKFLKIQAGRLIRSVKFEVRTTTFALRAPVFVRRPEVKKGYSAVARLRNDDDLARAVVVSEMSRAASALKRAHALAAAFGLQGEITAAQEQIDSMLSRVQHTSVSDEAVGSA